jgi:hypothetical protein
MAKGRVASRRSGLLRSALWARALNAGAKARHELADVRVLGRHGEPAMWPATALLLASLPPRAAVTEEVRLHIPAAARARMRAPRFAPM